MWEGFNHLTTIPIPPCVPCPQLLSESQTNMARLVSSVSDVLDTLQKERGGARPRLKADLQRAPARGARPRGCSNGETSPCQPGERGVPEREKKPPSMGQTMLEKGFIQCRGWQGGGEGGRWKGGSWKGSSHRATPSGS